MNSMPLLTGKTIIVTGASTGIGQAFALAAAEHGAHVVLADMNDAEETLSLIHERGAAATYVNVDVSNDASTETMASAALSATGRIDGLINNAAYFREVKLTPFEELTDEVWDRILAVNVKGIWKCCRAVMPSLRKQKSGSIVNIASVV
ncbi:MAG: SDR family NAD(P)-dependent oxidoreductase, partial [Burkholderiaceae bacterium]